MESEGRLPLRVQLAYGVGHVLNDVCASMWFSYLLVYFQLVLGAGAARAGLLLLVGQVADALATPFAGYHSDTSSPSRYGRRKSWHLLGTVCVLAAFPFIFSPCVGCAGAHWGPQLVYYSAFVVVFQIGWACVQVSHLALIPELSSHQHQRTHLTAIRYSFTVFSNVAVYLVTWLVLHLADGSTQQIGPGDAGKFQQVVWMGVGLGGVASLAFHCLLREPPVAPVRMVQGRGAHATLLRRPSFYQVAAVYMCTRLSVNLWQALLPLYLHSCLRLPGAALASVPLASFSASFLASLLVRRLNSSAGRKGAFLLGASLAAAACVWLFLGSGASYSEYQVYCVAFIFGVGSAVMLVTSLGLTADLIGATTSASAFVYGAMSFTDKLANGLAIMLIQHLSEGADEQFYRWAVALGCGAPALLGVLALLPPFTLGAGEPAHPTEDERSVLDEDQGEECS